jgi:hypothetical protein
MLHGGAASTNFILTGALRVSVYAPEATAKRAHRMILKGDMHRVLALLQSEANVSTAGETGWRQRAIGTAVAHCLKRVRCLCLFTCLSFYLHFDLFYLLIYRTLALYMRAVWLQIFLASHRVSSHQISSSPSDSEVLFMLVRVVKSGFCVVVHHHIPS